MIDEQKLGPFGHGDSCRGGGRLSSPPCRDALERQLLAEAGIFGLCEGTWAGHGGLCCHCVHPEALRGRGHRSSQHFSLGNLNWDGDSRSGIQGHGNTPPRSDRVGALPIHSLSNSRTIARCECVWDGNGRYHLVWKAYVWVGGGARPKPSLHPSWVKGDKTLF